jgi:hypothetical protein
LALRFTLSRWLFHHCIRHLSEQNFFCFLPGLCSTFLPQFRQKWLPSAKGVIETSLTAIPVKFLRLQKDFTVFTEIKKL